MLLLKKTKETTWNAGSRKTLYNKTKSDFKSQWKISTNGNWLYPGFAPKLWATRLGAGTGRGRPLCATVLRPGTIFYLGLPSVSLWPGQRGIWLPNRPAPAWRAPWDNGEQWLTSAVLFAAPYLVEIAAAAERNPVPAGRGEAFEYIYSGSELLPRIWFWEKFCPFVL